MYFEPTKKTYYRFPSARSVARLDSQMYFPEKPSYTNESSQYQHTSKTYYMPEREQNYDI
ncbi:MAG: hypothetical protein GX237_06215 [Clostridiales bacterium]|nr:hypothetical protein [Clostridiales bacterium]